MKKHLLFLALAILAHTFVFGQSVRIIDTICVDGILVHNMKTGEAKFFQDTTILSESSIKLRKAFRKNHTNIIEPFDMRTIIKNNAPDLCNGTCPCLNDSVEENFNAILATPLALDTNFRYWKVKKLKIAKIEMDRTLLEGSSFSRHYRSLLKFYRKQKVIIYSISMC